MAEPVNLPFIWIYIYIYIFLTCLVNVLFSMSSSDSFLLIGRLGCPSNCELGSL